MKIFIAKKDYVSALEFILIVVASWPMNAWSTPCHGKRLHQPNKLCGKLILIQQHVLMKVPLFESTFLLLYKVLDSITMLISLVSW